MQLLFKSSFKNAKFLCSDKLCHKGMFSLGDVKKKKNPNFTQDSLTVPGGVWPQTVC